jgi:branched-chain amino acid transport system permease protein
MSETLVRASAAPIDLPARPATRARPEPWRPSRAGAIARLAAVGASIAVALSVPLLVSPVNLNVVSTAAVYAIVALSLNVLIGYTGQVSLGHAAFLGVGGFTAGYALTELALPWLFAALVAVALGGLVALLLGAVALRVKGLYLALVTLAYGLFAERVLFGIEPLTGGGAGQMADRPAFAMGDLSYAYLCFAGLALVWVLDWRLTASKAGRAVRALRDSEKVAASWGINVTGYKLLAFVFSGAVAGLAGALFASIEQIVSPLTFSFRLSLLFLIIVVVGGIGSRIGVVLGTILIYPMANVLDAAAERWEWFPVDGTAAQVISAALLLLVLVRYPGGIAQLLAPVIRWCSFKPWRSRHADAGGASSHGGGADVRP